MLIQDSGIQIPQERMNEIIEEQKQKCTPYEYRTRDYPLEVLRTKFENGTMIIPAYQREYVWKGDQPSRFIESVLLGMPLTPFLVSETEDQNNLEIIDGSQRLRTLFRFVDKRDENGNKFKLENLKTLKSINGLYFEQLPPRLQNIITNRDFKVVVISEKADNLIRADIFDRINTSGEKLKDSEIRKGAYVGWFYDLVTELSEDKLFRKTCPVPQSKIDRGEYHELILRFFAYKEKYLEFKHEVKDFLDTYLQSMNENSNGKEKYKKEFMDVIKFVDQNFPNGFRKNPKDTSTPRIRFEAIAIGTSLALESGNNLNLQDIPSWLQSDDFKERTTTHASNSGPRLKSRIEYVRDQLLQNN